MLASLVPLCSTLGINADWRLITGDEEFFRVTKSFNNALQSAELDLTEASLNEYVEHNRVSTEQVQDDYDVYVVHDPQPVAIRWFVRADHSKWIWRLPH